jgi:hypothetical protein
MPADGDVEAVLASGMQDAPAKQRQAVRPSGSEPKAMRHVYENKF